jgi:hypothetical protein
MFVLIVGVESKTSGKDKTGMLGAIFLHYRRIVLSGLWWGVHLCVHVYSQLFV